MPSYKTVPQAGFSKKHFLKVNEPEQIQGVLIDTASRKSRLEREKFHRETTRTINMLFANTQTVSGLVESNAAKEKIKNSNQV